MRKVFTALALGIFVFLNRGNVDEIVYKQINLHNPETIENDIIDNKRIYDELRDFMTSNKKENSYYALRDLDKDDIPELIINQNLNSESTNSILSVYTYSDGIFKIGDYKNIGAGGIHISDNLDFPGLFHVIWGGGVENYWYLTVEEGELICEHVRCIDRSGFGPEITEISENRALIEETINVYESDKFPNNLLDMYLITPDRIVFPLLMMQF